MLKDDLGGHQALGPGGLDIVLTQGVQHGGAGQPGDIAHGVQPQGQAGHQVGQPPVLGRVEDHVDAQELEGPSVVTEQHQQEGGHHEARHGYAQGTDHPQKAVDPFPSVIGRQTAQRYAQADGPAQGHHTDAGGEGELLRDDVQHGTVFLHLQGDAKVPAGDNPAQIAHHLHGQRIVQAVLGLHLGFLLRRDLFVVEGAARHAHHQDKRDAGHHQDGDDGHDNPLHNVFCHSLTSYSILCSHIKLSQYMRPFILAQNPPSVKRNRPVFDGSPAYSCKCLCIKDTFPFHRSSQKDFPVVSHSRKSGWNFTICRITLIFIQFCPSKHLSLRAAQHNLHCKSYGARSKCPALRAETQSNPRPI